jgi:hypothetical protein
VSAQRRERLADWLMLLGAVLLFASLFLPWSHQFSAGFASQLRGSGLLAAVPSDPTAWRLYGAADVLLALLAAALVGAALRGGWRARLAITALAALALAFTVHAVERPPTNGTNLPQLTALAGVRNNPRAGVGETVAIVALAISLAGLGLSFTAE